jgi:hypothetical protein
MTSAIMPNQEQAIQNPEVCCDHSEKIHPDDQLRVILQKGSPKFCSPVGGTVRSVPKEIGSVQRSVNKAGDEPEQRDQTVACRQRLEGLVKFYGRVA